MLLEYAMYVCALISAICMLNATVRGWRKTHVLYQKLAYTKTELILCALVMVPYIWVISLLAPLPIAWYTKLLWWTAFDCIRIVYLIVVHHLFRPTGMPITDSLFRSFGVITHFTDHYSRFNVPAGRFGNDRPWLITY